MKAYVYIGSILIGLWLALTPAGCESAPESPSAGSNVQGTVNAQDGAAIGPKTSGMPIDMSQGWCAGHGVPESVCSRCNTSLIEAFKAANDWCAGHGLPESQCEACNPGAMARWAALEPIDPIKQKAKDIDTVALTDAADGIRLESSRRLLSIGFDPLCPIDALRVRFVDATILEKAGIRTTQAARRRISATIDVPAELSFDETRVTHITPRVGGIVQEAHALVGDDVAVGDVLAVLDSAELGEAKSRYIELRENLSLAQADLDRVQGIYQGTARLLEVCTVDARPEALRTKLEGVRVGEAKSKLLRAHAALLLARSTEKRERELLEKKISSQQDYDQVRSALSAAEAEFLALREEIGFTSERDRLGVERTAQVARSALDASGRRLHILGLSDEQIAGLDSNSDETLSRYVLRSPVAGRVIQRHMAVGEAVEEKTAVLTVADTSVMWLMISADARDLSELRRGLPVLLTIDGLRGYSFEGRVTWIASQVDEATRTVRARAEFDNSSGMLRAGMFGSARIILHDDDPVITVPEDAVQSDGCCQLVFVRQDETVFQPRKVILGSSTNGYVEIIDGLADGEQVATVGSFLMKTEILKSNIGAGCCEVDPGR